MYNVKITFFGYLKMIEIEQKKNIFRNNDSIKAKSFLSKHNIIYFICIGQGQIKGNFYRFYYYINLAIWHNTTMGRNEKINRSSLTWIIEKDGWLFAVRIRRVIGQLLG